MKKMSIVLGAIVYCCCVYGMKGEDKPFSLDSCIVQATAALKQYADLKPKNPKVALAALKSAEELYKKAHKMVEQKAVNDLLAAPSKALKVSEGDTQKLQELRRTILACIQANK